jgi:xanthine dehydrogenase YagS FAD-binding subunit
MRAFEYASPATLEEAVSLLSPEWGHAEVLAGGTDLLSLMKEYVATPSRLVNIKGIAELRGIRGSNDGLRIGALVTIEELLASDAVKREYAAVHQAAAGISSQQIRNMGTAGGELLQRPRCWYYRQGFGLLARDERGQPLAPKGDNRYHAILGNTGGAAYFVSPSSLAPALVALEARAKLVGPAGAREVELERFFVIPQKDGEREHALRPNEILTEVLLPSARDVRSATYEVRQREALDWPLAAASVALRMNGGAVESARIVLGHVGPKPWLATQAGAMLSGKSLTAEMAAAAGEAAVREAQPLSRNQYKVTLARVAVKRALIAAQGA